MQTLIQVSRPPKKIFQSNFLSALQCRLDCHAGYVAHKTPIITCVKGSYQPQAPHTFVCAPAVALLLSTSGEVEVFSKNEKCNQKIFEFPSFGGQGRSLDLLDEQLILLGADKAGRRFEYKSIHQPRKGLLGMRFSQEVSPVGNNPFWHTSHSYGNQLLAIGGEFRSKAGLANTVWNGLNLRWQNGSSFYRFAAGACKVKLARDVFLMIGGFEIIKGANVVMNTMLRLNITEEKVEEWPSIKKGRAFHSCEIFQGQILIAGGTEDDAIVPDEVYDLTTNVSTVLDMTSSLQKQKHQLLRIEETTFSFGGVLSDGTQTSIVEWFDWTSRQWKQHDHGLLSKNSSNLVVTSFPLSAVDCHAGCTCGRVNNLGGARIVGGNEAKVNSKNYFNYKVPRQNIYCY